MAKLKTRADDHGEHKLTSPTFKARVLAEIGKYDRRGYSQHKIVEAIAPLVKLSQPRVCQLLKEIREQYKSRVLEDRTEKVNEMLEAYRDVRAEAWASYEKSKADSERLVRESVRPHKGEDEEVGGDSLRGKRNGKGATGRRGESVEQSLVLLKEVVTTEGRLPANVYLQTVLDTLKAERDLLGLDAPKTVDVTTTGELTVWDRIAGVDLPQLEWVAANDPVERMIDAAGEPADQEDARDDDPSPGQQGEARAPTS